MQVKTLLISVSFVGFLFIALLAGAVGDRVFGYRILDHWLPPISTPLQPDRVSQRVVTEESVVIDVVEQVSSSVVTVGVKKTQRQLVDPFDELFDPFGFFGQRQTPQIQEQQIEQDIGTGFVISKDGLIVTNKHVVADTEAQYKIITKDNKEYQVEKIYRDSVEDLAILKVNAPGLMPVTMGDSDNLKVGQFVIAIGTALGEFRNTVTTGVISGLGRGVTAGDPFGVNTEALENMIQTDAAINPGNSGGPLLNSSGQVIGVNVAMAGGAQNISFAVPINIVKEAVDNFNKTGKFERAYLGVRYKILDKSTAISYEVPEGAWVAEVIEGSPAEKAGIEQGDIITKLDGGNLSSVSGGLAELIQQKKIGDVIEIEYWREGKLAQTEARLEKQE